MSHDSFDFKFLIPIDHLGWWLGIVGSIFLCFMIAHQQGGMKNVMDGPGWGELEAISDW